MPPPSSTIPYGPTGSVVLVPVPTGLAPGAAELVTFQTPHVHPIDLGPDSQRARPGAEPTFAVEPAGSGERIAG